MNMRNLKLALALTPLLFTLPSFAADHPDGGHARGMPAGSHFSGARNGPGAHPTSIFPSYARPQANMRNRPQVGGHAPAPQLRIMPYVSHEDHFGNRVTDDHMNRVQFAHERSANVMRNSPHVNNQVSYHSAAFASTLHPVYERKSLVYQEHFNQYHTVLVDHPVIWRNWHEHHFYGGFYYGFHPITDMSIYFYNPMVHWFYVGTWDDAYYRTWYANEYEAYPALNHPFNYYGVYYPTDNLRQLLFGVSAMPVDKQARFRSGITEFTQKITQDLANYTHQHVALSNGDIVVTHYETLGADDGVDVEGSVNFQAKAYNFKGFINLDTENATEVFVTGNGETAPSPDQLSRLDSLNHSIDQLRGEASPQPPAESRSVGLYPSDAPASTPTPPPASAEVSADPK
jgi:hypothetical protein